MGLLPSRESLHKAATAPDKPLPYISRPAESYVYKTNRTERIFGSGVPGVVTGITPLPAALPNTTMAVLHGAPSLELSQKIANELPDAVFIDDPAEASAAVAAAVAASRPSRRGSGSGAGGQKTKGSGHATGHATAKESTAAQALRCGKAPFVYYYEHRVLPLTSEFFPSPDCILFRQLWSARQQQNPRYHFQLDQTWSPGALLDPTAHYESFMQLAGSSLVDIQAACITATGTAPTRGSVLQAQADLDAAKAELSVTEGGLQRAKGGTVGRAAQPQAPLATREEFYNLVVRTTEESMLYETDDALRNAVQSADEGNGDAQCKRLRPVPCAIVLVRRCMAAQEYRYTYYLASHERHHRTNDSATAGTAAVAADQASGGGQKGGAARRRGQENQRRDAQTIAVTGNAVHTAVIEAQRAMAAPSGVSGGNDTDNDEESLVVPWLQVSVPQAPLDLAEVRVVGMYGCWTIEEILRHSLFLPAAAGDATAAGPRKEAAQDAETTAKVDALLRRACPHGVPSSTLLNVGFFEKQVGDKEQCHAYFSLCRLFAHGMRECILHDVIQAASVTALETTLGGDDTGDGPIDAEAERERMEAELRELKRQQEHPTWQAFLRVLAAEDGNSGGGSSSSSGKPSVFADLSNCFLIRFSYVPQLQLCRQLRLLLTGMSSMYPEPISLEAFQAAQRRRNLTAMAKKLQNAPTASDTDERGTVAASGSAKGGTAPPTPHPASTTEATSTPVADPASQSSTPTTTKAAASAEAVNAADSEQAGAGAKHHPQRPSLNSEMITERHPEHISEARRLQLDGFCCYASDGLVVFRISRACVARALSQLGFALIKESIEALCVTLTATAPPPLTYRGELRPPVTIGGASGHAWTKTIPTTGSIRDDADAASCDAEDACEEEEHTAVYSASAPAAAAASADSEGATSLDLTMAAVKDLYCNAIRYSRDPATGFAAQRLFCSSRSNSDAAPETPTLLKVPPLEHTPSELIGVLPRNPIEQRRGRLLPLRGLLQETRANHLRSATAAADAGAGAGSTAHAHASLLTSQQQQQLLKVSEQHLFDVYTVSVALDGMPFRRLVELTHEVEQQRHTLIGNAEEQWPQMFIEAVDAQGNTETDSVLNWSPMAALGGQERHAQQAPTAGDPGVRGTAAAAVKEATGDRGEPTKAARPRPTRHSAGAAQPPLGTPSVYSVPVPVRVHDPDRILRTGDRIRFAACQGSTSPSSTASGTAQGLRSLSGDLTSPSSTSAELLPANNTSGNTPSRRSRKAGGTVTAAHYGYWYVDDSLTTEDMVLSWMRRISGRARETHGNDTKWVRYPSVMLSVLLQFVRLCRQKPSGTWLNTGHQLRLLHPMDEELVEWDMLQNFPDIVRTRRFRQWRFSHDGYVYFHGVTVRMPGSAPPLQAAPLPLSKPHAEAAPSDALESASMHNHRLTPYESQARVRHVDATSPDAVSTSTQKPTPPAPLEPQQEQQNVFTGVPRPPPVMQYNIYGSFSPYPNGSYPANASPQMAYTISSFNPNVLPGQSQPQQQQQQQQLRQEQQPYPQMPPQPMSPPQAFYYASPINVNTGLQMQPQQPSPPQTNMPVYVPMTCGMEPYYMQQPANILPIPQPHANATAMPSGVDAPGNNASGSNNVLYFDETDVATAQARNANSGDNGGRSPGGGSQQMHFSLHHMESANSLRSFDWAASNAMLGPTHVTSSFYGELYGQSSQQQPPPALQQQQKAFTSVGAQSAAGYRKDMWLGSGSHSSEGVQPSNGDALASMSRLLEAQMHPPSASADARGNDRNVQAFDASPAHGGKQLLNSNQQQQLQSQWCDPAGRASGVPSSSANRRSTTDYPPRRISAPFLAGSSCSTGGRGAGQAPVVQPTVQRAVSRPIQTSPADPTERDAVTISCESGAPLHLPTPKSHTAQAPPATIQQQQQQQQQGSSLKSPLLSSSVNSREYSAAATTADVIEADGITVHVMQRKASTSVRRSVTSASAVSPASSQYAVRHSSYSGGAQAQQAGNNSNNPQIVSAADAAAEASYGAMGVSPTGCVDATAAAAAPPALAFPEDGHGALGQPSYEMPAVMTPTYSSRANSFAAGCSGGPGNRSISHLGGGPTTGVTTPPQRHRSLRVSHNPYAAHGGASSTSPVLAHISSYSHGGGAAHSINAASGGVPDMHRGQSGQDAFQAALDAQYGGESDFGVAGPATLTNGAWRTSATAHGALYGLSDPNPNAAGQGRRNSFYAAPEDAEPQQSYSSHEMYRDKIADGTTQGFYYSMDSPIDNDGAAAQQLYGRDEGGGYHCGPRQDGSFTPSSSMPYSNIPAPPALHRSRRGSY
ncbi:hypothetical protein ABL78_3682 [Leptomonas seymouri]|uniref:Uncharacterized protein n=1 Tax=Leptomonas seymouri TaxID=5684 RepID=A0A0N1HZ84_LEPSE|nr:hypothetical protein ABL78_3682 [Leptomonas seymouri]|eukprot:KPI87245.1 hypothetical protein ABL78_3682 [Leptomonas seymouri]